MDMNFLGFEKLPELAWFWGQDGLAWSRAGVNLGINQWRSQFDNWGGGNIHLFVFCIINFFWNWLFLRCAKLARFIATYRVCDVVFFVGALSTQNYDPSRQPREQTDHPSVWFLWRMFAQIWQRKCMEIFHWLIRLPSAHRSCWRPGRIFTSLYMYHFHMLVVRLRWFRHRILHEFAQGRIFRYFSGDGGCAGNF